MILKICQNKKWGIFAQLSYGNWLLMLLGTGCEVRLALLAHVQFELHAERQYFDYGKYKFVSLRHQVQTANAILDLHSLLSRWERGALCVEIKVAETCKIGIFILF
jgi:hypothetical protein